MSFEKMKPIEGGHGGCLHCGYQHSILPMELGYRISVGFGYAALTRDGEDVFRETNHEYEECPSYIDAEIMAANDPNHDWRIHLEAPLSSRHYQRQGLNLWVLYAKGAGFA